MERLKKMPGHTRHCRRGAVYYHRAAVSQDIVETYGKREETFSLKTRDYAEALRKVRVAAVEVDRKFDEHRIILARKQKPTPHLIRGRRMKLVTGRRNSHRVKRPGVDVGNRGH